MAPDLWNMNIKIEAPNKIMCSDADGCAKDYPVRWCEHSDPGYDNSTHGWPGGAGSGPESGGSVAVAWLPVLRRCAAGPSKV